MSHRIFNRHIVIEIFCCDNAKIILQFFSFENMKVIFAFFCKDHFETYNCLNLSIIFEHQSYRHFNSTVITKFTITRLKNFKIDFSVFHYQISIDFFLSIFSKNKNPQNNILRIYKTETYNISVYHKFHKLYNTFFP